MKKGAVNPLRTMYYHQFPSGLWPYIMYLYLYSINLDIIKYISFALLYQKNTQSYSTGVYTILKFMWSSKTFSKTFSTLIVFVCFYFCGDGMTLVDDSLSVWFSLDFDTWCWFDSRFVLNFFFANVAAFCRYFYCEL